MPIELPKKYYSFNELASRFQCSEQDLSHLVIERQITPSVYLDGGHYPDYQINKDEDQDGVSLFPTPVLDSIFNIESIPELTWLSGFHYLVWMQRTGVTECEFLYASKTSNRPDEGDIVYRIERQLCLQDVLRNGVVMADELERFEALHDKSADSLQAGKPLATRERDTLLNIIGALVELIQTAKPGRDSDAAVIKELLDNYSDKPGIKERTLQEKFAAAKRSLLSN